MPVFSPGSLVHTVDAGANNADLAISYLVTRYTPGQIASTQFLLFRVGDASNLNLSGKVQPIISPPEPQQLHAAIAQELTIGDVQSELITGSLACYVQGAAFQQIGRNYKLMVGGKDIGPGTQTEGGQSSGLQEQIWDQQTSHNYNDVKVSYFLPNTTTANASQARTTFQNHTIIQWGDRKDVRYVKALRRSVGSSTSHTEGNEQATTKGKDSSMQWSGQNITLINGANIEVYAGLKSILNTGLTWNLYPLAPTFIFHLVLGIIQIIGAGACVAKLKNRTLEIGTRLAAVHARVFARRIFRFDDC